MEPCEELSVEWLYEWCFLRDTRPDENEAQVKADDVHTMDVVVLQVGVKACC